MRLTLLILLFVQLVNQMSLRRLDYARYSFDRAGINASSDFGYAKMLGGRGQFPRVRWSAQSNRISLARASARSWRGNLERLTTESVSGELNAALPSRGLYLLGERFNQDPRGSAGDERLIDRGER